LLELRTAQAADALPVARVHVRSWQVGYRALLPASYLAQLRPEERAQRYTFGSTEPGAPETIVAVETGVILGFATTAPARDADLPGCGELCALYVEPAHWGRGIGRTLMAAARARLLECGFREAALWTLAGNARAESFYRADGWAPDGLRQPETRWGIGSDSITIDRVRYRRRLDASSP
jgi:GNAT superfamily N-acetyltransferase